mmetsp:Transcript_33004/g.32145  ORF Transcript_33004/g.32145 Transcript_33004/m.32145 type:complete len:128 (+) Transcript_33004:48-431(+)
MPAKGQKSKSKKIETKKFVVDCSTPADDEIFDSGAFEAYLHERVKVNGKVGNLGSAVTISREGNKITITANVQFSKRYVKYLTKKFLKKKNIRDWLRVVATTPTNYELRYFNINPEEEDEGEDPEVD